MAQADIPEFEQAVRQITKADGAIEQTVFRMKMKGGVNRSMPASQSAGDMRFRPLNPNPPAADCHDPAIVTKHRNIFFIFGSVPEGRTPNQSNPSSSINQNIHWARSIGWFCPISVKSLAGQIVIKSPVPEHPPIFFLILTQPHHGRLDALLPGLALTGYGDGFACSLSLVRRRSASVRP